MWEEKRLVIASRWTRYCTTVTSHVPLTRVRFLINTMLVAVFEPEKQRQCARGDAGTFTRRTKNYAIRISSAAGVVGRWHRFGRRNLYRDAAAARRLFRSAKSTIR